MTSLREKKILFELLALPPSPKKCDVIYERPLSAFNNTAFASFKKMGKNTKKILSKNS
jgi:hypothetical protein